MRYALLCYANEEVLWSLSNEGDDSVLTRLNVVHRKLVEEGTLGPVLRLMPTTTATTLRGSNVVADGPFAETREQLLGVYVIDVPNLDGALAVAGELWEADLGSVFEVRPVFDSVSGKR